MGKRCKNRLPENQSNVVSMFKPRTIRQQQLVELIEENEIVIAKGPAGTGKSFCSLAVALSLLGDKYKKIYLVKSVTTLPDEEIGFIKGPQPLYSKVSTPFGWKEMGDLKIGDIVHAYDGSNSAITDISDRNLDDLYRIELADGRVALASKTHGWYVKEHSENRAQKRNGLVSSEYLFNNQDKHFFLPLHKAVEYNKVDLELDPYLLGVLLGDGIISGDHIRFASNDSEIVDRVKEIVEPYNLVINKCKGNYSYTISAGRSNTQKGARILARKNLKTQKVEVLGALKQANEKFGYPTSKTTILNRCTQGSIVDGWKYFFTGEVSEPTNYVRKMLSQLELIGKCSWEKSVPNIYKYNSIENRIKLLNGLMDTDGSVKPDGKDVVYYTTSKTLAEDVKELVTSLGGIGKIFEYDNIGNVQEFREYDIITRRKSYQVYIKFYDDKINPFFLPRKAERFIPKENHKYSTKVVSVTKVGEDIVQCITIDHPSHLYLTDDFIVTHNSVNEKMEPFMMSFMWNIDKICGPGSGKRLLEAKLIEILPLAFIRGISIDNAIVIADEVQDYTAHVFKSIISRIGEDSKYIFLGDSEQIDLKRKSDSCLNKMIELFQFSDIIATIEFTDEDCVRNPIIPKILSVLRDNNI